jgi:hypothetical protein
MTDNNTLFVAIIAALSALLGSLIPTVVGYLNSMKDREFELKKELLLKQKHSYLDVLLKLQAIINDPSNKNLFIQLQEAAINISIFGDDKTSEAFSTYYYDVLSSGQGKRNPLTAQEHKEHQLKIINNMRITLGLNELKEFEIVALRNENHMGDKA